MYQCMCIFNDEKVGGLEPLLKYMMESFFSKDGPAINEHHYRIIKQQYNEEAHNVYNINKTKGMILNMIDIQMNIITKHNM